MKKLIDILVLAIVMVCGLCIGATMNASATNYETCDLYAKATVVVGATLKLTAKLSPTGAKTAYTWTSSDKKVATVNSKGVVKALKAGKATITVKTANGKKATCKVTVRAAVLR